jgi:ABC-type glycerol-3-phosphate transport system substrate-binding protein
MTPGTRASLSRRAALAAGWGFVGFGVAASLWPRTPRSRRSIPPGRTVIDYWEKWTGPEGDAIQRVVDDFNESQSKIYVRRTAISEIDTKAMVAIGGGDPPDVCGVFSYNVPQYAQSGAAIPLESFGGIDASAYIPSVRALLSHRGKLIAGVSTMYTLALYYNRVMLQEAGIEHPPRTLRELDAAADKLTIRDSSGQITRMGFLPNLPLWWPYTWPILFGSTLYDPATNGSLFGSAECVNAYQWVRGYPSRLGEAPTRAFGTAYDRSYHSPQDPFISGRVAMIAQGPWLANFIARYNPKLDYNAVSLPVDERVWVAEQPLGMVEADVLVIPRGCRHPEAAFEFVKYTQTQKVQEQLAREHTKSSALAASSPSFMTEHPNRCVHVHDVIAKSPRVSILPQTTVWKSYAHLTEGVFDAAWKGDDVPRLCASVHTRVQQMLDRDAALRGGGGRRA